MDIALFNFTHFYSSAARDFARTTRAEIFHAPGEKEKVILQ
jgi:hypothetical protein